MLLGKRKRDTIVAARLPQESEPLPDVQHNKDGAQTDTTEIFRKFFEETFSPLDPHESDHTGPPNRDNDVTEGDDSDPGWDGLSDASSTTCVSADDVGPEIISYQPNSHDTDLQLPPSNPNPDPVSRKEFMSSRPPPSAINTSTSTTQDRRNPRGNPPNPNPASPDPLEALNLKNDTLLHHLLQSSSLLPPSTQPKTPSTQSTLKTLLRTIDPPNPTQHQNQPQKIPLPHRRGMRLAQTKRHLQVQTSARESGIVLARPSSHGSGAGRERPKAKTKRVLGRGDPGVGTFEKGGATLRLSERDVRVIQGGSGSGGRGGRGRGGDAGRRGKRGK